MVASDAPSSEGDFEALFATDIPNNVVKLKNVILNEFHVLRKFSFISLCNETLRIKLESDLGSQIGFQIDNENFDNENNVAEQTVATFLADDFNQLFNTVNLVSEVVLQPRQVQQVILTFRPCESSKGLSKEKDDKHVNQITGQNGSAEPLKRVNANVNQVFQVNGRLSFTATGLHDSGGVLHGEATKSRSQNIIVQFNSTVCQSVLKTDVSEIVFEDCVPGGVFVKDFSIWNLSEIPGSFELHVKSGRSEQPVLDLTDYDTGFPISRGDIKSFSHRRIRVTYKPKDVGDYTYLIHLQNNYDERNSKSVPFRCIVNPEQRQEGLLVTGVGEDGVLDFGDCYSGNGTCQLLTLRNVTQEALVVNLSSDHASGDKVTFYRQTDLDLLSAASKACLKDVVSHDEDGVDSLEGAQKATLILDKLGNPAGPSVIVNKKSKVDLISLGRGEEKNLLVWLFPAGASDEAKAARLQRRNFRLSLKCVEKKGYSKQRFSKIIQCKAQICTSIVKLSTQELNFGDCNVGSTKASSVQIHNLSDLPALITSYVISTIISIKSQAERVSIPPRQTHSLDIDLVPLKINHKYRKQIRVDNLLNKDNNQVLEVRAKIMDRHHVLFHSIYYKLRTPSMSNSLTFDSVVVNNPCVKILSIENITDKELTLDFNSTMPEELGIYVLQDDPVSEYGDLGVGDICSLSSEGSEEEFHDNRKRAYAASVNKEKILETLEESQPRLSKAIVDSAPFPVQQGHSKTIPPRSPFSASDKKTRMRMSLDLATSPLSTSLTNLPSLETGPLALAAIADESLDEAMADVKPFADAEPKIQTATLKRVQSDAMLNAGEEAPKILASSQRASRDEDYLEEVLNRLGYATILDCSFADEDAVKKYIDNHVRDRELTMHALEDIPHTLMPLGKLDLHPGETRNLYVILVVDGDSHVGLQGRLQKLEAKVTIEMIEYDKERQEHLEPGFLEPTLDEDLLTREIPAEINVCRALLSLAQKNISFGKMLTNEHRAKTLVLNNVSDVPFPYKIKKTGSIASGDLHIIDGRTGVLQPHSSQEVNFVFQPSLGGSFHETLIVSNVYDPNNDQVVNLKATISRAETFWLKSTSIDFGAVISGQWSSPQSFVIYNTSKQSRTFMLREVNVGAEERGSTVSPKLDSIRVNPAPRKLRFALEPKTLSVQGHVRPEQEAIEALERKALAYERKGKADKVAKIRREIDELKAKEIGAGVTEKHEEAGVVEALDLLIEGKTKQSPPNLQSGSGSGDVVSSKLDKEMNLYPKGSDGFISFNLKPSETQVVLVSCLASMPEATPLGEQINGAFLAYESKNQDVVKHVHYEATVCSDNTYREDRVLSLLDPISRHGEDSPDSLPSPSPTLTPDSSVPPSPSGGQTPQSLTRQYSSRKSSASNLFSSIEAVDLNLDVSTGSPSATSRRLLADFEQSVTEPWDSEHLLSHASFARVEKLRTHDSVADGLSGHSSPRALFRVDLLKHEKLETLLSQEQPAHGVKPSSTAMTATRLSSSHAELAQCNKSVDRDFLAGEVVLEDHADGDKMEGSFLLRSLCSHDIWINFLLDWHGDHGVELWVSDLGFKSAGDGGAGVTCVLAGGHSTSGTGSGHASTSQPRQLKWQQLESLQSKGVSTNPPKFMASSCLKGGTGQWVTLRMLDEVSYVEISSLLMRKMADVRSMELSAIGTDGTPSAFGNGLLTMQAQPDGIPVHLLVRAKQLERYLKVTPSDIVFPESDLPDVLTKEISIKNRSRSEVEFEIKVSVTNSPSSSGLHDKVLENMISGRSEIPATSLTEAAQPTPLIDPVVCVSPAFGRIKGNGSLSATIICRPVKSGKQSYMLHIRSSFCSLESHVSITMVPRKLHCLRLPDVPIGSVLDMGYCFINAPEGAKVVPLRLENLFAEPLSLSFRSNLTKQVYISLNATGSPRADEMRLLGAQLETVYLCLRPGGDASAYKNGHCREVIGGMRFTARSIQAGTITGEHQEGILDEIMVKFRATVGRSLLQVSTSLVDLGRLEEIGGFISGHFVVSNPSNQMPLKFSLSSGRSSLSVLEGHLIGREATPSLTGREEKSEMTVEYCLPVTEYGLIEDQVVVQNLSCPGQNAEVTLRVYVDCGRLKAQVEPPLQHCRSISLEESALSHEDTSSDDSHFIKQGDSLELRNKNLLRSAKDSLVESSSESWEKTPSVEEPWPAKRTFSLPAFNVEHDDFYDRSTSDTDQNIGPLQDNGHLDMGTVYISLGSSELEVGSASSERETTDFHISDLRPYHSSVLLTNLSDEIITLQPVSTLPVLVSVERQSEEGSFDSLDPVSDLNFGQTRCTITSGISIQGAEEASGIAAEWSSCGSKFSLQPGYATRLLVACQGIRPLSSADVARLSKGKLCAFEGLLAFCKMNAVDMTEKLDCEITKHDSVAEEWGGSQFVELLTIKGSLCVSTGEVVMKEINLGKVGDANGWEDLEFDVDVHNCSDADLIYEIVDTPNIFSFPLQGLEVFAAATGGATSCVAARKTDSIQVILHTSKLEYMKEARTWSWKLRMVNCNNLQNVMEVSVVAEMTVRNLRFGGLNESTLLLPPLNVPAQPYMPSCSTKFTVENLSTGPMVVALELHQGEDTESLVMLEVTSESSNTSIVELTLQPGEKAELRVGARLVADFIPRTFRADDAEKHYNGCPTPGFAFDHAGSPLIRPLLNVEGHTTERPWLAISNDDFRSSSGHTVHENEGINHAALTEDITTSSEENFSEAAAVMCLGHLYLYSSPLPDCIDIHGTLNQGPMFDVSPNSLQFQAKLTEKDTANNADGAESGVDALHATSNSKLEKDHKSVRLGAWDGLHDKSNTSQRIVVHNFLAFNHLQFKVWAQETLLDDFGSQLRFMEVHPQECLVAPNGSVDVTVKSLLWSSEMYEAFLKHVSEKLCTAEYLTMAIFIQDVEERDSRHRLDVRIKPPLVSQKSFPQDKLSDIQLKKNRHSNTESISKELIKAANHLKQSLPVLGLRGCTAVNGSPVCYEFNLGQQNISSGGHRHWNLTLVGDQELPISYRLCTISNGDAGWLSISSSAGVVEALQQDTVKLSFSTKAMGVYSTYLVVENLDNPADLKTVHLSMEVVALKNARPESASVPFFYVLVQGDRAEGAAVDMAEIYYNFWYRNRSFVVVNEASVAMEFLLSSTLDHNDSTELNFSLENTSLKRFSSVTVDAKSSIRLWIHFCIGPPKEEPLTEDTCDELTATIFVNCRLVKDYQRCIPFRAKCRYPQIGISSTDIVFSTRRHGPVPASINGTGGAGSSGESCSTEGPVNAPFIENEVLLGSTGIQQVGHAPSESPSNISHPRIDTADGSEAPPDVLGFSPQPGLALKARREDDLDLIPPLQTLVIRNLYLHRKLEYLVKNDSLFFEVDLPELQEIPGAGSQGLQSDMHLLSRRLHDEACQKIVVRPNLDTLRANQKMIMKQKYVEEHLTIYNRSNPREKYTVSLRITAGHLRNFFAAPGPKNSYIFERLELAITCFLSSFYSLMNGLSTGLQETSILGQKLDLLIDSSTRDRKGSKSGSSREAGLGPGNLVKHSSWSTQNQDTFQELEKCLESFSLREEGSQDYDSLFFDLQYLTDELVFYSLKERWSKGGATLELSTVQLAKLLYCALYRCQIFQLCLDSCHSFTALATQVLAEKNTDGEADAMGTSPRTDSKQSASGRPDHGERHLLNRVPIPPRHCFKFVEDWTGQLRHFLSFFPDTRDDISSLRDLNQQLQEVLVSCRIALDQNL